MKLHLPHKLCSALLAVLAEASFAICPLSTLADEYEETFISTKEGVYTNGIWTDALYAPVTLDGYEAISIDGKKGYTEDSRQCYVGDWMQNEAQVLAGGVELRADELTIFTENGGISFTGNDGYCSVSLMCNPVGSYIIGYGYIDTTVSSAGAIYNGAGECYFSGNEDICFERNSASAGNWYSFSCGEWYTLEEENSFDGKEIWGNEHSLSASSAGAIYNEGVINFSDNGNIHFSGNQAESIVSHFFDYSFSLYGDEYAENVNGGVSFVNDFVVNATATAGGAIHNTGELIFHRNADIVFEGCSARTDQSQQTVQLQFLILGEWIAAPDPIINCNYGSGVIYNKESLSFIDNHSVSFLGGGFTTAICNDGYLSFEGNGDILFCENKVSTSDIPGSYSCGGAVCNRNKMTFSRNGDITFSNNSAYYGGAIYNAGELNFSGNGDILFLENDAFDSNNVGVGVSIYNDNGAISFNANRNIEFSNNDGIVIGNSGTLEFANNSNITFSNNNHWVLYQESCNESVSFERNAGITFSSNRVAIYSYRSSAEISFTANGDIAFIGNKEGAIRLLDSNNGKISFIGNGDITFSGNGKAISSFSRNFLTVYGNGISFMGNGDITFWGNSNTIRGGAISFGHGDTLSFAGNGNIIFQGNFERETRQLRSVYGESTSVATLSATTGKSITFYDSIYTSSSTSLELNKSYEDAEGNLVAATGAIVFSGATTEADLASAFERCGITDAPTEAQILASRTSEIGKAATLYAGSLVVRDNAVLNAAGITVLASAEKEGGTRIVLDSGTLNSDVTLAGGTSLHLAGANSMSGTLILQDGAGLDFVLGDATPHLTLSGTMVQEGGLVVGLSGKHALENGRYELLTTETFDTTRWTSENVSVSGVSFSELEWSGNILYYNRNVVPEVTWNGGAITGSGSATWDKNLSGWLGGDWNMAFTVKFTDAASGTVTLVGELSPEGVTVEASADHFYVFSGEGSLTGEMSLTKKGKNMLTINTVNSYTGGTFIHEGTVVVGNAQALGLGTVLLKNGALDLMGHAIENAIFAEGGLLANAHNYNGDITIGGEVQLDGAAHANNWLFDKDALGKLVFGESLIESVLGKEGRITGATISSGNAKSGDSDAVTICGAADALAFMDDVHIDIAEGSTLVLENIVIGSGVRITDDPATTEFHNTHIDIVNGENAEGVTTTVQGISLADSVTGDNLTLTGALVLLDITSDTLTSVTMDGTSLVLNFSGFDLVDVDLVRLVFGEGDLAASFSDGTQLGVTGTFGGDSYTGMWKEGDANGVYFAVNTKNSSVPEPATGALSVLALAALAMRRRRKAA